MNITPSVAILLCVSQSTIPIKGNVMASGDDKYDTRAENKIRKELKDGNIAAWFDAAVAVQIEWEDDQYTYEHEGTDYLGGCSYNSLIEFAKEPDGYFLNMVETAWDEAVQSAKDNGDVGVEDTIVKPDLSKIMPSVITA